MSTLKSGIKIFGGKVTLALVTCAKDDKQAIFKLTNSPMKCGYEMRGEKVSCPFCVIDL